MKKSTTLFTVLLLLLCNISFAQYHYFPYLDANENPRNLNQDDEGPYSTRNPDGWEQVLGANVNAWSTSQTIPFDFEFDGNPVSEYIVAPSGVLSFSTSTTVVPPVTNTSLPSADIPDSSICIWGIQNTGSNDIIKSKTYGTAPNRQHWIMFADFSTPIASTSFTYWSIVLEETTNHIYLVDMRTRYTSSSPADLISLTLGVQIDINKGYEVTGSPNIDSRANNNVRSSNNTYYEFIPGLQANIDLAATNLSINPLFPSVSDNSIFVEGSFENIGKDRITSFDFNYSIDGGTAFTEAIRTNIGSRESTSFEHDVDFDPTTAGNMEIAIWVSNVNGSVDEKSSNDTLRSTINISDTIPNRIDSIRPLYRIDLISRAQDRLDVPTDLDFHPDLARKELWVINRRERAVGGATVTYSNAGEANQTSDFRVDGNAFHFMALPSGIAFSNNGNFANSASVFNANSQTGNGGQAFTGPALWSSDPAIYAQSSGPDGPFANGSHYDMLHQSPYTMGIAHEVDNAFWVFDANSGDVVRYDFVDDHGPGNDDHSDGKVHRYPVPVSTISSSADQEVPSHLVLDKKTNWLYIADQKAGKVFRLDITSGISRGPGSGSQVFQQTEALAEYINMRNITYETYIDSGLVQPSGIELINDRLLVSDYSNGDILVYDISTPTPTYLSKIITGRAGISGIKVGPEGNIWFVNPLRNEVSKIVAATTSLEEFSIKSNFKIYPNPSSGMVRIDLGVHRFKNARVLVSNPLGQVVLEQNLLSNTTNLDLSSLDNGLYIVTVTSDSDRYSKRLILQK